MHSQDIDLTADEFKDLFPCTCCDSQDDVTTFAFESVKPTPAGANRTIVGGLCSMCIGALNDEATRPKKHRELEGRLTCLSVTLDKQLEGRTDERQP